jgi:acyl-coenzyme A thioesterase PaaI-like protein
VRATHHELCFGCGLANVFGLGLEAERGEDGSVRGRFFVKQDHQGADGRAHPGILAAALVEALSLAAGAPPAQLSIGVAATPAVGTFVAVTATASHAEARDDEGTVLASAHSG